MSNRRRPDYVRRKAALEAARREALRTHPQPCDCWACITPQRVDELVARALARNTATAEEILF